MKKTLSKVISAILLALAIAVTQIPVSDVAAQAATSDFQIDNTTLVKYAGVVEVVSIPDGVKTIGEESFADHDELVKITIGADVEKISNNAFAGCDNLRTVVIGDQVTEIESAAFSNCKRLENVTLGTAVSKLGDGIFAGCSLLTDVTVAEDNTHLLSLDGILYDDELTTLYELMPGADPVRLTIPNTVKEIRSYAFWGNPYLEDVTLGSGMNAIPGYAFSNCKNLKNISIPYFIREIGPKAFEDCVNLGEVTLPESISAIHETAFDGCTKVSFSGVEGTYAGDFAANWRPDQAAEAVYQDASESTIIPASEISGAGSGTQTQEDVDAGSQPAEESSQPAQYEVTGVVEQSLMGQSPIVSGRAVVFIDNTDTRVYEGNESTTPTGTIDIANGINTENATQITSLLGDTEEKGTDFPKYTIVRNQVIADHAFYNDQTLTEYEIPDGITEIGEFAFARSGLSSIVIPQGVTEIGYGAFYHCDQLSQVSIPDTVTDIAPYAFEKTPWMESFRNSGTAYLIVGDGVLLAYQGGDSVINIPGTVKRIGPGVFQDHTGITAVNIPTSVVEIGEDAFAGCRNLTTVNGGENLTTIKDRAFQDCAIQSVTIPAGVTSLGVQAFDQTDGAGTQVTFLGTELPELSFETAAQRLSGSENRGYVFGNISKALVPNAVTDLSGTVLQDGGYGMQGTVYHEDGSQVEKIAAVKSNVAGIQIENNSQLTDDGHIIAAQIEGSSAPYILRFTDSAQAAYEINQAYAGLYGGREPAGLVSFDMSLYDETGNIPISRLGKQNMTVTIPLPDQMGEENLHIVSVDRNGQLENRSFDLVEKNGVTGIQFTTNHCSNFGIYQYESGIYGTATVTDGQAVFDSLTGNKDDSPDTGDHGIHPKWFLAAGLLLLAIAAFFYNRKETPGIS